MAAQESTTMTILITTAGMNVAAVLLQLIHVTVNVAAPILVFRARDVERAMLKIATTPRALPGGWAAVVVIP